MTKQPSSSAAETHKVFRVVEISREPVELYKILKFESMVGSGGEAKAAVASGQVLLNGMPEIQKRKKIVSGDTIEFGTEKILIKLSPSSNTADSPTAAIVKTKPAVKKKPVARKEIHISKGRTKGARKKSKGKT